MLDENWEACDYPIDCQVNNTVKAQKSMKGIVKIVHLPSVVQSEFYEATRKLFVHKKKKKKTLFNNSSPLRHFGEYPLDANCVRCSVSAAPHFGSQ